MIDGPCAVVIPAAGSGRRMGGVRKPWIELDGEPVLLRSLRPFLEHPRVRWVVVALRREDVEAPPSWLVDLDPRVQLVVGGDERSTSVMRALDQVPEEAAVVLVHDAARPLVTRALIDRTLAAIGDHTGAIAALPMSDTVKRVVSGRVVETPDRAELYRAQTPQGFRRGCCATRITRPRCSAGSAPTTRPWSSASAVTSPSWKAIRRT
jgi:2-C-methyl-D-erythritol 4-phosphate cytidylyltransferase